MKVFAIKAYGNYGAGMAIVAANSAEEAQQLANQREDSVWHVRYGAPFEVIELPVTAHGYPEVLVAFEYGE